MFIKVKYACIALPGALALVLSACGGGSSGQVGASGSVSAAGISVSSGPITGFGSVFVNGVEYDTSQAQILMNGVQGTQDDLRVGMMVNVTGSVNAGSTTGTASRIDFNSNVVGIVDSVDVPNNTLVVLGQTVVTDDLTVFDGGTLSTLRPGNVLEVSGMVDSGGVIHATRIDLKSLTMTPNSLLEVKGRVTNLDTANMTFDVGAQPVDYASAVLKQLPDGLSNGLQVEVNSTQGLNADGVLIAAIIEGESIGISDVKGTEKELEGLVTDFTSDNAFSVNGQAVSTTPQTVYKYGVASDIALNTRLEVEGIVDDAGVLFADKVVFKPSSSIDVSGDVQAVDASAGTVTLLGIQFTVDANTQYHDVGVSHMHDFRAKGIAVGDSLEIHAYKSGEALIAARIERKSPSSTSAVVIRASLESMNAPQLQVLGVAVITDAATFFFLNDAAVSGDAFFAAVQVGDAVKVMGMLTGDGTIHAARIQKGL